MANLISSASGEIAVVKIFYNILQRLKTNQANEHALQMGVCLWVCGWIGGACHIWDSPRIIDVVASK